MKEATICYGSNNTRHEISIFLGKVCTKESGSLKQPFLSEENLERIRNLRKIAQNRGQSLAQMALAWCLRDSRVTSVLFGASTVQQIDDNVKALDHLNFSADELNEIDRYAIDGDINLWAQSSQAG
jgi:L-glyceraldehyde 3-phosphate reductase